MGKTQILVLHFFLVESRSIGEMMRFINCLLRVLIWGALMYVCVRAHTH